MAVSIFIPPSWFTIFANHSLISKEIFSKSKTLKDLHFTGNKNLGQVWKQKLPQFYHDAIVEHLFLNNMDLKYALPLDYHRQLPQLHTLVLEENKITGTIPQWQFRHLRHLDLNENKIEGTIPEILFNYTLETLLISKNLNVTGPLPPLHWPNSLNCLDLRGTNITAIPENYFRLSGELMFPYSPATIAWENTMKGSMYCSVCNHTRRLEVEDLVHCSGGKQRKSGTEKIDRRLDDPAYIWCQGADDTKKCRFKVV